MNSRRYFSSFVAGVALVLALAPALCGSALAADPRPNIVHIMADDLGWQDIASHRFDGEAVYETPHLDRLTREGRRFTRAYSPSPTCAPSRVAFLRGQYPARTGVYHVMGGRIPRAYNTAADLISPYYPPGLDVEEPTIAEALRDAGYLTGHVGKWHAGGKHAGYPFPVHQGFEFSYTEEGRHKFYNDPDLWRPQDGKKNAFSGMWSPMKPDRLSEFATSDPEDPFQVDEDGRPFDKPLDLALGFIGKQGEQAERPFFLNFCTYLVHGPISTRDRARLAHYCEKMGYPFPTDPGTINPGKTGHSNPYYASMVDSFDWIVGQIIECLETTDDPRNPGHKLIDNTYIILDSDNGGWVGTPAEWITDNSPLRSGKMSCYEGGIRIPFLVRGPGVAAGSTCDTPINLVDLFPTFLAMAGIPADPQLDLDGCDILPLIRGEANRVLTPEGDERGPIFWFYPVESHMSSVILEDGWKLVRNDGVSLLGAHAGVSKNAGVELYRIAEDGGAGDMGEVTDVAATFPERRDALLAKLDAFLAKSGATLPYRNLRGSSTTEAERQASPAAIGLGSEEDRVWVEMETAEDKAAIVEAFFLCTLNPRPFDSSGGHRQEWIRLPATIGEGGRIEASMPPGATHGAFCMRDANGFLVTSEPMPSVQEVDYAVVDSELVADGFAYRPGLFALIRLGEEARAAAGEDAGEAKAALTDALEAARQAHAAEDTSGEAFCTAIGSLRVAIRQLEGVPQAAHPLLNRFPTDPLF